MGRSRKGGGGGGGGELGVNKKGTPLYSREDIREQYCINDKELQVLDRSQRKSLLGCFSNQGQASISPCTGGHGGKRGNGGSFLGSCIARTTSEDDLAHLEQLDRSRRPISPGHRGTTWTARRCGSTDDEDAGGFDSFRRRPKSFCITGPPPQPPPGPHSHMGPMGRRMMYGGSEAAAAGLHLSMGSLLEEQQRAPQMYYGPNHPLMRASSPFHPPPPPPPQMSFLPPHLQHQVQQPQQQQHHHQQQHQQQPQSLPPQTSQFLPHNQQQQHYSMPYQGGYTLPPAASYFPVSAYSASTMSGGPPQQTMVMEAVGTAMDSADGATQPNTPDLLIHRRQQAPKSAAAPAAPAAPAAVAGGVAGNGSDDERGLKSKHVSFDSSSLMRSQTIATMDESTFQRTHGVAPGGGGAGAGGNAPLQGQLQPSQSSERLIDNSALHPSDFAYYSEMLPPELARQLMLERLKRSSMRTMSTQTDNSNNRKNNGVIPNQSHIVNLPKVSMISEGVQTNGGLSNGYPSPPQPPMMMLHQQHQEFNAQSAALPLSSPMGKPPPPPRTTSATAEHPRQRQIPPHIAKQLPGYKLQVYHLDGASKQEEAAQTTATIVSPSHNELGIPIVSAQQSQQQTKSTRRESSGDRKHHHHHHHHSSSSSGKTCRHHKSRSSSVQQQHQQPQQMQQQIPPQTERAEPQQHTVDPAIRREPSVAESEHVSDRELPELAPIIAVPPNQGPQGEEGRAIAVCQEPGEREEESRKEPLLSSTTATTTTRSVDETTEEEEEGDQPLVGDVKMPHEEEEESDDIGKQLSPLGSNSSSLQDVADHGPTKEALPEDGASEIGQVLEPGSSGGEMEEKSLTFSEEDSISIPQVPLSQEPQQPRREGSSSANVSEAAKTSTDISDEQHEDQGADDEASSSPAPKESTGGSSTPMGIATPPEEERETDKDDSGRRRFSEGQAGVNGTCSSASEDRPEAEEKERRTNVMFSGDGERTATSVRQEERASEEKSEKGPVAPAPVPRLATEGDTTVSEDAVSKSKRKQELTLDLGLTASSPKQPSDRPADPLPSTSEASAENVSSATSESGLIWQRVNMGTGDVQKKRQAFEQQIKSQTSESDVAAENKRPPPPPVAAKPINKAVVARKIVGHDSPVGGGGLARSPAMREGFRSEEWVVKRTPINTPVTAAADDDGHKLVVGMINLSDEDEDDERGLDEDKSEEDETSLHLDSEAVFKSGATTPPGGGNGEDDSMRSSLAPSSLGFEGAPAAAPAKETAAVVLKEMTGVETAGAAAAAVTAMGASEEAKTPIEELEPLDVSPPKIPSVGAAPSLPFVKPPQGFGDSPEKNRQRLPGSKMHLATEQMQPEELLTAEQHAAATGATPRGPSADTESAKMTPLPSQSTSSSKPSSSTCSTLEKMRPSSSGGGGGHGHGRRSSGSGGSGSGVHVSHHHHHHHHSDSGGGSSVTPSRGSKSRSRSSSKERLLSKLADAATVVDTPVDEDEIKGLYAGGYRKSVWAFIGKLNSSMSDAPSPGSSGAGAAGALQQPRHQDTAATEALGGPLTFPLRRSASIESTQSEREFRRRHQAITHRMVHRKSSAIMYNKILERTFECNQTVCVQRVRGEFGFRIHGSRPVVVSAIEPNTPAESSGLKVGDIILSINGVNVLDLPHAEVVRTAQTGRDVLELGLARVEDEDSEAVAACAEADSAMTRALDRLDDSLRIVACGYLWKMSRGGGGGGKLDVAGASSRWMRRWFVLRADSCLYFFKTEHEIRPLGAFLISGGQVSVGCPFAPDNRTAFTVRLPSHGGDEGVVEAEGEQEGGGLYLAAESEEQLARWISATEKCVLNQDKDDLWLEIARQRQTYAAFEFSPLLSDCRGFLLKLDGRSKTWKKRFCVLCDACLYLYVDKEAHSAIATVCLHGYRVQSVGSLGVSGRRHAFELIPPESRLMYFYFVAETETEKKRWMASLEYSVDRWMKLSEDGGQ